MASGIITMVSFVLNLAWNCIYITPANQKHALYVLIFPNQDVFNEIASTVSLTFAPHLLDTLQTAIPPIIAFFSSLPTEFSKQWAIYLLLLEKPGSRPRIYIGSGTGALYGVSSRFSEYNQSWNLPQHIQKAIQDSYIISHRGLLCWASIPDAALQPRVRILFIALEAALAYGLWAMRTTKSDYGMAATCLWPLENLGYDGLCSHCALAETVSGNFNFSPEQLESQATEKKRRRSALKAVVNTNYRARQIATNPDNYRTRRYIYKRYWIKNNSAKVKQQHNNAIAKAKATKAHYCEICDLACSSKYKLVKYKITKRYLRLEAAHQSSSKLD